MSSSIKVNLEKDSYDIIFDENFVESAMALIAISSKCMFITQEIIYEAFEEKFSVLKSLPNVEFHLIETEVLSAEDKMLIRKSFLDKVRACGTLYGYWD